MSDKTLTPQELAAGLRYMVLVAASVVIGISKDKFGTVDPKSYLENVENKLNNIPDGIFIDVHNSVMKNLAKKATNNDQKHTNTNLN